MLPLQKYINFAPPRMPICVRHADFTIYKDELVQERRAFKGQVIIHFSALLTLTIIISKYPSNQNSTTYPEPTILYTVQCTTTIQKYCNHPTKLPFYSSILSLRYPKQSKHPYSILKLLYTSFFNIQYNVKIISNFGSSDPATKANNASPSVRILAGWSGAPVHGKHCC